MNNSKSVFNRRLFAIVISFALVLVSVASLTLLRSSDVAHADDPTSSWTDENNYDTSWYVGHESDTEYTLTTSAQFAGFAYLVNNSGKNFSGKTIKLDADIDLNGHYWTPIGMSTSSKRFNGTFDGQEHTISHMTVNTSVQNSGLFGYVYGATIRNVILASSCSVTSTTSYVGGIAGYAYWSSSKIENVTNNGSVSGTQHVGGIVGYLSGTIKNATNNGSVTGTNNIGGIAGSGGTIKNATNNGSVTGTNNIGGIVGYLNGTIKNATNNGSVTGTNNIGGIVGYLNDTIENVTNNGSVSGTQYVGGIVGYVTNHSTIKNATNTGNVTGTGSSSYNVGGIAGYVTNHSTIDNATNTGDVTGTDRIGGIVGALVPYNSDEIILANLVNLGTIYGNNSVGGIVGRQYKDTPGYTIMTMIYNSYNTGAVTATGSQSYAGGIVANQNDGSLTIVNSYNAGAVTGSYNGGILGYKEGTVTLDRVYYLDTASLAVGSGSIDTGTATAKSESDMKDTSDNSESLLYQLNAYVNSNPVYTVGTAEYRLRKWKISSDNYPSILIRLSATYNGGSIVHNENIQTNNIVITEIYSDASTEFVSWNAEGVTYEIGGAEIADFANYAFNQVGAIDVTVKYGGQETVMTINVVPYLTGIAITYNGGDIAKGNKIQGDDIVITATYSDDSTATVSATDGSVTYSINGTSIADITTHRFMYEVGTVAVTVKYGGQEAVMNITVVNPIVTGIAVTYNGGNIAKGEKIQGDKILITATYSDDSTATVSATDGSVTYSIDGVQIDNFLTDYRFNTMGTVTVTVSYNGQNATIDINVVDPILTGIEITYNGGDIAKGNKIQGDDIVITATYSDDSTATVSATDENVTYSIDDGTPIADITTHRFMYEVGTVTVTVSYNGQNATIDINVVDPILTEIAVTYNGGNIAKGNKIESDEIVINEVYSDDSTITVSVGDVTYSIDGVQIDNFLTDYRFNTMGTVAVTVSYNGQNATIDINVVDPIVTEIAITYNGGDIAKGNKIQGDDIVITATYSDDSTATISADNENVSYWLGEELINDPINYRFNTMGTIAVTVKYNGQEAIMNLTVVEPILMGIEVTYNGGYIVKGEKIQGDKIVITATYSDDSTATISADNENVSYWLGEELINDPINYRFNTTVTIAVTVKYNGQEAVMQLTVIPPIVNLTATYTGGEIAKGEKIQGDKLQRNGNDFNGSG